MNSLSGTIRVDPPMTAVSVLTRASDGFDRFVTAFSFLMHNNGTFWRTQPSLQRITPLPENEYHFD